MPKKMSPDLVSGSDTQEVKKKPGRPRLDEPSPEYLSMRIDIIEAAAKVFQERGYDAGTLKEVADEIGITTGNIYYYLKNKQELLYEIILRSVNIALKNINQVLMKEEDAGRRLRAFMEYHIDMMMKEQYMFSVFFEQREKLQPKHSRIIRDKEREYIGLFRKTIDEAVDHGYIPDIKSDHAFHAILGMCNWVYKWYKPSTKVTAQDLADEWFKLLALPGKQ